jgi:membrane-bound lytic murein transglycosylase A
MIRALSLCILILLAGCAGQTPFLPQTAAPKAVSYTKTTYTALPGWQQDNVQEAWGAFLESCKTIVKKAADKPLGPDAKFGLNAHWQAECLAAQSAPDPRAFFESRFTPLAVTAPDSLFTGYYEASLEGSRTKHGVFQTPVYARPDDFVTADLGAFLPELKGKTLKGRVEGAKFVPYPDRAGIERTSPPAKVLAWVKDPVDVFFLHIQGSGRITLDDGSVLRVGYDEQNGHSYVPIGRVLKARNELTEVTMETIRAWLAAHPTEAQAVMNENPSYIFFRELGHEGGPLGAQGVPLTPLRSIAVDKALYGYGMPFFVHTEAPVLNRLMIAQDTGGAIKGPVRADVFWGYGTEAAAQAGPMQSKGAYWILVPNVVAAAFQ